MLRITDESPKLVCQHRQAGPQNEPPKSVQYDARRMQNTNGRLSCRSFFSPLRSNALVFAPGQVELSLLLSIHEDGEPESNEFFDMILYDPWGGARLGSQHRTRVTVIDAQTNSSSSDHTFTTFYLGGEEDDAGEAYSIVAGTVENVTLVAKDALGRERGFGGDVFAAWVEAVKGQGILDGEEFEVREAVWSFRL